MWLEGNLTMWEIIGQVLGIAATATTALSYQFNTKKKLLLVQTAATLFTCLSYLCLGAMSGFALNIVCLVRNSSYAFVKEGTKFNYILTAALMLAMAVFGALSWQGPVSLLIIIALILNTLFMSFGKPQLLRYTILLTSTMILIYNIAVFSIGGIMNEGIAIISSIIGIIRFFKAKNN